jgi:kynurenine formamidase
MKARQIMLVLLMVALLACSFLAVACAKQNTTQDSKQNAKQNGFPEGQWIDLSYDLSSETIYWPTAEPFKRETVAEGFTEKGYYYSAYKFCAAEHGGTHIDAPIHFAEGRKSVDEIPLSQLIAPAIKIDVSNKASANRDYRITVEDFTSWESENGQIPDGSIVLLETGFGRHWPDRVKYLGTDKRGPEGVAELHFPGLHHEAAQWLVENRKISAVGLDTASIDYGQTQTFDSHVILMTHNIPAFENVANIEQVPKSGAQIVALPIKIKRGSGGPLRIVAFVPAASR